MSNLPGDLSAASHPEPGATAIEATEPSQNTTAFRDANATAYPPKEQPMRVILDDADDHDEEDRDDDLESQYNGKSKLRDLSGQQVEQFPGIKREHWW